MRAAVSDLDHRIAADPGQSAQPSIKPQPLQQHLYYRQGN